MWEDPLQPLLRARNCETSATDPIEPMECFNWIVDAALGLISGARIFYLNSPVCNAVWWEVRETQ